MIKTAVELHKFLVQNESFDFRPEGRDLGLYNAIKLELALPPGEFLKAMDENNVSAERYLHALLDAAKPLSQMYLEILAYCEKANFLQSKNGAKVEWSIKSNGDDIDFMIEKFRCYSGVVNTISKFEAAMGDTKNEVMNWLAHDVFAPFNSGLTNTSLNWQNVEMFKILEEARVSYQGCFPNLWQGLNRLYLGGERISSDRAMERMVTDHLGYHAMLKKVKTVFDSRRIENLARDFVQLPFWKFRWQVYEIWGVTKTLVEFEKCGFKLVSSSNGHALAELGQTVILATNLSSEYALVYQPRYTNRTGMSVHPDLVVAENVKVEPAGAAPENVIIEPVDVALIVESKQRVGLTDKHVSEVFDKYSSGVEEDGGQVVIINYDNVSACTAIDESKKKLIQDVHPTGVGESKFVSCLHNSNIFQKLVNEIWYVDISMSMNELIGNKLRGFLELRRAKFEQFGRFNLFGFAEKVDQKLPSNLIGNVEMSNDPEEENWEGKGIRELFKHIKSELSNNPRAKIRVISDIASGTFESLGAGFNFFSEIEFVNPTGTVPSDMHEIWPLKSQVDS
ncbi:hypothetical protein RGU75_02360 [Glaciimonas sp. CA11.2]|uniref:hypothetical protein n=1 Tax=Glaciimonas sp. CA11.2 TaxID=3048601 RepID=UPI002AB3FC8E|nr:hypothetical protein [Glaciimonas sp. CA11.2]MDY7545076.1 hypothetical protein [Glaciimonas sp. CA11.2]